MLTLSAILPMSEEHHAGEQDAPPRHDKAYSPTKRARPKPGPSQNTRLLPLILTRLGREQHVQLAISARGESYIIPPMSGMAGAAAPSFSGGSATMHSVVRMFLAIDAAFCSAERVTIVGSMTPAAIRSP